MGLLRQHYEDRRRNWAWALQDIAKKHGEKSWAYNVLGGLAWGRFEGESHPNETKDHIAYGFGYLSGYRDACLRAAELAEDVSEEDFRCIYRSPRMNERR